MQLEAAVSNDSPTTVRMLARTGQPIDHWFWGRIVHDMAGISHKDIIPADYCHTEECGFLDKFEVDDQFNLNVAGKLVPTSAPDDIARKIIERSKGGVPYEASIDWTGEAVIEEVFEGFSSPVNGYQFEGPGVIVRQWPLRGVAVCPYGADSNTSTSLKQTENLRCKFIKSNTNSEINEVHEMAKSKATQLEQAEDVQVIEAETAVEAVAEAPVETVVEAPTEAAALTNDRAEAKRFRDAFGDKGAVWFAEGLNFDEARSREVTELKAQVADLTAKLAARKPEGEADCGQYQARECHRWHQDHQARPVAGIG